MTTKTTKINVTIQSEIKEEAEAILKALGMTPSIAIQMFYRQIIMHHGLPFKMKIHHAPFSYEDLTEEQLNTEIAKGLKDVLDGNVEPEEKVFEDLFKDYQL